MNRFSFKVLVKEAREGGEIVTQDVGTVEVSGPDYEADMGAAALDLALSEMRINEPARLVLWRGFAFPREAFRGLQVELCSKWADA